MEVSTFNPRRARSQVFQGYSYKSSQHGLALDNVVAYELVLPNGTALSVTSKDDDLWFGLRASRQVQYKLVSLTVSSCREVSIISYVISLQPRPISWLIDTDRES